MRTLGVRLMDHFGLHQLFDLTSTLDLFGGAAHRAHYTSVLRYPVLKKSGNYAGDSRIATRPFMRLIIEVTLADELAVLPKAWLVPFGPNALRASMPTPPISPSGRPKPPSRRSCRDGNRCQVSALRMISPRLRCFWQATPHA
jgi:hypothetical protein